jgi:hypothetical protein
MLSAGAIGIALFAVTAMLRAEGSFQKARWTSDTVVFPLGYATRAFLLSTFIGFSGLAVWLFLRQQWVAAGALLLYCVAVLLFWPGRIEINSKQITQSSWGRFRKKTLALTEVATLLRTPKRTIKVIGTDRTEIQHSGFHSDGAVFEVEMMRRTGISRLHSLFEQPTFK